MNQDAKKTALRMIPYGIYERVEIYDWQRGVMA